MRQANPSAGQRNLRAWLALVATCQEKRHLGNFLLMGYLSLICSNTSEFSRSSQSQFLLRAFKTKNKQKGEVVRVQEEALGWRVGWGGDGLAHIGSSEIPWDLSTVSSNDNEIAQSVIVVVESCCCSLCPAR